MASVDVVIPCYGYGHFLEFCVESVLNQPGVDARVLVIDDCSPDDTPAVAARLVARDARVHYRRHERNQGHIATYNEGLLGWASADYVLLLSADDALTPGALGRAVRLMDADERITFVYGPAIRTSRPCPEETPAPADYATRVVEGKDFIEDACRRCSNVVATPTAVVRTTMQKDAGGYDPNLRYTGDLEMWLRLAARGRVGVVEADQAFYRIHTSNMSERYTGFKEIKQFEDAFESFFAEDGRRFAGSVDSWRRSVRQRLARTAFYAADEAFERGDAEGCEKALELARSLDGRLRRTSSWIRLQAKRAIGRRAVKRLRGLIGSRSG